MKANVFFERIVQLLLLLLINANSMKFTSNVDRHALNQDAAIVKKTSFVPKLVWRVATAFLDLLDNLLAAHASLLSSADLIIQ